MKSITSIKGSGATCLVALLSTVQLSTAFAQGEIIPPGPPGPIYKTLQQVEPRTAITNTGPVTISAPGSYYLTTNINVTSGSAITIAARNVTLDLNGFTIASTAFGGTGSGILLDGAYYNVAIRNGHISGREVWDNAFLHGISWSNSPPINVQISDVSVYGCGINGIQLGDNFSTVVERCTVDFVGAEGIRAGVISHSTATRCGGIGIIGQAASHCYAQSTTSYGLYVAAAANCHGASTAGTGIYAFTADSCYGTSSSTNTLSSGIEGWSAQNCRGLATSGSGILAYCIINCFGRSVAGRGINAGDGYFDGTASNSYGVSSTSVGLSATTASNCYGDARGARGDGIWVNAGFNCFGLGGEGGKGMLIFHIGAMCYGSVLGGGSSFVLGDGAAGRTLP